jgi:DUF3096 family protein
LQGKGENCGQQRLALPTKPAAHKIIQTIDYNGALSRLLVDPLAGTALQSARIRGICQCARAYGSRFDQRLNIPSRESRITGADAALAASGPYVPGEVSMNLHLTIGPIVSLIAGVLILVIPRLLNYIVATYLILMGLLGLFGSGSFHLK